MIGSGAASLLPIRAGEIVAGVRLTAVTKVVGDGLARVVPVRARKDERARKMMEVCMVDRCELIIVMGLREFVSGKRCLVLWFEWFEQFFTE